MGKKFWVLMRTYCLESTLVGLKYFYLYPDLLSRLFWASNMLTASALSFMITWLLYWRFEEMPTRITIDNQFESVHNLPYPSITLCSPNQMTISSMEHFKRTLVEGNITIDLEEALPLLLGYYELIEDVKGDVLVQLNQILDINRYSITEIMSKMALSCERFLKGCFLGGKRFECTDLFQPIMTTNGYCCTFNSKYVFNGKSVQVNKEFKNFTVKSIGLHSSLSVVTDFEPHDAISGTLLNAGSIRVMLTDWTEFPVDYETFLVDTNGVAYLFLSAVYTYCSESVKLLPTWSRNCNFENEQRLDFFKKYHNSDCDHMCYVLAVFKSCNCWLFFIPYLKIESICKPAQIACIINVKKNMSDWLTSEHCNCPRDCESRRYRADLTLGNFDAFPYLIESQNLYLNMKFNVSTSVMNFLFSSPIYVKQKQETVISFITLVSNLGGVFGLFLGCSGITVLEIIFYVYIGVRSYLHRKLSKLYWKADGYYE